MKKILIALLIICCTSALSAYTYHIYNGDSIQDSINAASDGDEIIVYGYGSGQGEFDGFDYIRKDLDIHSAYGYPQPIINGGNDDVVIDMTEIDYQIPGATPRLSGFKIIGLSTAIGVQITDFGGLYADIENNIIDGVETGIYLGDNDSSISVTNNKLLNNDIAILNKETTNGNSGNADVFEYNTIYDNDTGMYLGRWSESHVLYSLFYDNDLSIDLTDDFNEQEQWLTLDQCTISNTDPYTTDNGIYVCDDEDTDLIVINSILYGNARQIDDHGGTVSVTYSDVEGDYTGTGNIDADPYFCMETYYEFHLMEGSPCIDAGDPSQTDSDGNRMDMGCFPTTTDIKYCEGNHWNWISFPRLDRDDNDPVDAPPILDDFLDWAFDLSMEDEVEEILAYTAFLNSWNPSTYNIRSTEGFKLDPEDSGDHYLPSQSGATRLDPDWTLDTMYAENEYFIGYWLPKTQNIEDAFGDFFDDVFSVEAEDWYYEYSVKETPSSSTEDKNMVYGKAYIIEFDTTVVDFCWDDSGSVGLDRSGGQELEYFSFNDLPCYEVIDIMDIPENVVEIGVFEDESCVGAVVVQDTMEQVLAYTSGSNRSSSTLSFELVTNGRQNQVITDYKVYDPITGIFEDRTLFAGQQKHSVISFGNPDGFPEDVQDIGSVILSSNYPNPFNPVTNISFSLPQEQEIELTVYNMKGQKVCQLVKGHYTAGKHSVTWDGTNDAGNAVASGLYLYRLITSDRVISKKMLMLK